MYIYIYIYSTVTGESFKINHKSNCNDKCSCT